MKRMISLCWLAVCCSHAQAVEYGTVQSAQSRVTYLVRQMGVPVEGAFRSFSAQIAFDPQRIEQGKASVSVDVGSIDTGMAEADAEVAGPGWFDTRRFPTATFVSSGLQRLGAERLQAKGKLTLKGQTREVVLPFSYREQGGNILLEGAFPIRRSDFAIGSGVWADPDVVADEVQVRFRFVIAPISTKPDRKGE